LKICGRRTIVEVHVSDNVFMNHHSSAFAHLPVRGSRGLALLSALLLLPLGG